jgi:hypothetical protein
LDITYGKKQYFLLLTFLKEGRKERVAIVSRLAKEPRETHPAPKRKEF